MNFRWPWRTRKSTDRLVLAWASQSLAYVQGRQSADGAWEIQKLGVEHQGADTPEAFQDRLAALQLHGGEVLAMLRPEQYQLLQIDAPKVAPEELRQAARYQIREMVDVHLDDLTVDVLRVGDGESKGNQTMFVVAAKNEVVREVTGLAKSMEWPLSVIDIAELAQRNLQTALAARSEAPDQASATLVVVSERQAVITISARGELYFSRRLDLPDGFMEMEWGASIDFFDSVREEEEYKPVVEYVPDYAASPFSTDAVAGPQTDMDRAQRVVVEVQRSLDLWERTWRDMPLSTVQVFAAEKSLELATWLTQELGHLVHVMDVESLFPGFNALPRPTQMACLPLLGQLMRTDGGRG